MTFVYYIICVPLANRIFVVFYTVIIILFFFVTEKLIDKDKSDYNKKYLTDKKEKIE